MAARHGDQDNNIQLELLLRIHPSLVRQLQASSLVSFRDSADGRSDIAKCLLDLSLFRPGREVCDLVGIGNLALRERSHHRRFRPFHDGIDGLVSITKSGTPTQNCGNLLKIPSPPPQSVDTA